MSSTSTSSSSSCESDSYEEYYDQDFFPGFDDRVDDPIHPMLQRDIDHFVQNCPDSAISFRILHNLREVDVELKINLDFMQQSALDAWGLCHQLPLILNVNLDFGDYINDKGFTKLDVFQDKKRTNSILIQLKNIGKVFCQKQINECATKCEGPVSPADGKSNGSMEKDGNGILFKLYMYICQRLETLNDYCPICDKPHGATSMLKPTVCCNPLCIFSSQTLGVMYQVTDILLSQPEVVNLLIVFTKAAILSPRRDLVLTPFPSVMDFDSRDFMFTQDEDGHKLLRKAITSLSSIQLPSLCSELELKNLLNSHGRECYPLLRWMISSNRSHILCIPEDKQIPMMLTNHQYLLRNSPPSEDAQFKGLAKQHGSSFAFHGSPLENWHSIIRHGLVVASGTDLELNGAASGKGIYVSPDLRTALSYSGQCITTAESRINRIRGKGPKEKITGLNYCVALCEVITAPTVKRGGNYMLIPSSQFIRPRIFFLYPLRGCYAKDSYQDRTLLSTSCEFIKCVNTILSDL